MKEEKWFYLKMCALVLVAIASGAVLFIKADERIDREKRTVKALEDVARAVAGIASGKCRCP